MAPFESFQFHGLKRSVPPTFSGVGVAIYRLLREASFDEADVGRLGEAYESCLKKLRLIDRHDTVTELIAAKIIEVYRSGEHDPAALCARTFNELGISEPR